MSVYVWDEIKNVQSWGAIHAYIHALPGFGTKAQDELPKDSWGRKTEVNLKQRNWVSILARLDERGTLSIVVWA